MVKVNTVDLFGLSRGRQTPTQYDRRKKIADMLIDKGNEKPVSYNFAQGLSIVAPKIIGGILGKKADDEEEREEDEANETMMSALKGLDPDGSEASTGLNSGGSQSSSDDASWSASSEPRRSGGSGGGSRAYAANERRQRAVARLVEKGYSQQAAEGVADNFGDESGFNTKAVGDNGTAFGIAQWRGPRFAGLKRFAAQQGKDWQDFDTQVDYADYEMRTGSDQGASIAFAKLQRAADKDEAYNAFVTHFERPSKASLQKRLRQVQRQVRQPRFSQGEADYDGPPPAAEVDTRQFDAQIQSGIVMMRNPRTRDAGFKLYQQGITGKAQARQQAAQTSATRQYEDYKYRRDRGDRLADEADKRDWEITRDDEKAERERRNKTFQLSPGQRIVDIDGNVIAEGPPKADHDADIEVGPNGEVRVRTGKLTEVQSKDIGFFNRGAAAEIDLRDREEALLQLRSQQGGRIPVVGNYLKSPEYRAAEVPARQFLAALLRKDTGAAVTDREFELYGAMFLPVPGDDEQTMALKRRARAVALKSIRTGLGTAEALADAYPDLFDRKGLEPKPIKRSDGKGSKEAMGGYKIGDVVGDYRYTGGDPTKRENWEPIKWN